MRAALILIPILALSVAALPGPGAQASSSPPQEKKKGGGASYIQFPTLTASVLRPNGRRGVLTVEAGLDVADGALRTRAELTQPRLRDAYIRILTTYAAAAPVGGPPDPDAISAALQRSTDQVLGKPGAKLLLGTVMVN
jgi:flagellar basal body-associated protein FliL